MSPDEIIAVTVREWLYLSAALFCVPLGTLGSSCERSGAALKPTSHESEL